MTLVLNDDIFPRKLIYLRKKKKLSQKQLALQSGITVYYLRGIELSVHSYHCPNT